MKETVEIIRHKGKTVFFSDYTGIRDETALEIINSHYAQHRKLIGEGAKDMLFLTDVTGAVGDREMIRLLKETTKHNAPYTRCRAVVGVEGIQRVLLNGVVKFSKMDTRTFDSREDALEWLTK